MMSGSTPVCVRITGTSGVAWLWLAPRRTVARPTIAGRGLLPVGRADGDDVGVDIDDQMTIRSSAALCPDKRSETVTSVI
jgi:hypothetical protein